MSAALPEASGGAARKGASAPGVADPIARLVVQTADGERSFYLSPVSSIGRHTGNSIQILDKIVSKEHCRIEREGARFILRDLGSLNGTRVNGERVRGAVVLNHGDVLTIGSTRAFFHQACPAEAAESAADAAAGCGRFLAHLTLDRPFYRPGEMLYARAAVLEADSRLPLARPVTAAFEVRSPRGEVLAYRAAAVEAGVAPFSWALPARIAAGEYTLVALFPAEGFPPGAVAFSIHAHKAPHLDAAIAFARGAYGPGDEVVAALSVTQAGGAPPVGARVTAVAIVDGDEVHRSERPVDATGSAAIRFRLPAALEEGEGEVRVSVLFRGVEVTATQAIPIAARRLHLALYPEGGDLVVGLPARLYLEARSPRGAVAAVAGRIIDSTGATIARFRAEHEGRARVVMTPERAGRAYVAVLDEPRVARDRFLLPEVAASGFTLHALDDVTAASAAVRLRVGATAGGEVRVALYARDREVAAEIVALSAGEVKDVALTPTEAAAGVLRATVYDATDTPRAERLVFRRPPRAVRVAIEAAPARAALGSPVVVTIRTTSDEGEPVPATVTVAVVDAAVLEAVPARDHLPRLPAQALLGSEVRELGDAAAYLGEGDTPARRLDLLLGTQGWRRFAFYDAARFLAEHGDHAARVLARQERPVTPELGLLVPGPRSQSAVVDAAATLPEPNASTAPHGPVSSGVRLIVGSAARAPASTQADRPAPFRAGRPAILPADRPPGPLAVLREYAHRAPPFDGTRADFRETLFWSAGISTGERGEATIRFDLCDSVTAFQVRADAFTEGGALGAGDAAIDACRPFSVHPTLPAEISEGDIVELPIELVNETPERLDARMTLSAAEPLHAGRDPLWVSIGPRARSRTILPVAALAGAGVFPVKVAAVAAAYADQAAGTLAVTPGGFPAEIYASGQLEPTAEGAKAAHRIVIPASIGARTLVTELVLAPTPLSAIAAALDALGRAPSFGAPPALAAIHLNATALAYLAGRRGADPRLVHRAASLLERASQALTRAEGRWPLEPLDVPLLAYAARALAAIAAAHPTDREALARARALLLSYQQAGPPRDPSAAAADAHITWALGQARTGEGEGEAALARAQRLARESDDPYLLALAVNALLAAVDPASAAALEALAARQGADGAFRGGGEVRGGASGEGHDIETTALAILALLKASAPGAREPMPRTRAARVARAMAWLSRQCKGGRFGGAQATVAAVEAIVAYDAHHAQATEAGLVRVCVDGERVGAVGFTSDHEGPLAFPSLAQALTPGERLVELELEGNVRAMYALRVRYQAPAPPGASRSLGLMTALAREEVSEGDEVDLLVDVVNMTGQPLPRVTAVLGVPAGLSPDGEQLRELTRQGRLDGWEARGRELWLYRRAMAKEERWTLAIALRGEIPGTYLGPPSRAYAGDAAEEQAFAPQLRARVRVNVRRITGRSRPSS